MRKIGRETGINGKPFRQISKRELNLMPYNLQSVQLLTNNKKLVQLRRYCQLLRRAADQWWEHILFTDKKLFDHTPRFCGGSELVPR